MAESCILLYLEKKTINVDNRISFSETLLAH